MFGIQEIQAEDPSGKYYIFEGKRQCFSSYAEIKD
jgi:hypothetical protein